MEIIDFHPNGFIVKSLDSIHEKYMGVEGECWEFENTKALEKQDRDYIRNYISETIQTSWFDDQAIDACCDVAFVNKFINTMLITTFDFHVLFCETDRTKPNCSLKKYAPEQFRFIGFDYAYPGGSFYSAVFNDLYSKRIRELADIKLNEFGLIPTEEALNKFIQRRNELIKQDDVGRFELGDFVTYKLWHYTGEYPIIV